MFRQFKFEEPLYQKLDRIPISTQFKLEGIGSNFPLDAWNRLPLEERWVLCHLGIRTKGERECYSQYLAYVLRRQGIAPVLSRLAGPAPEKKGLGGPLQAPFRGRPKNAGPEPSPFLARMDQAGRYRTLCPLQALQGKQRRRPNPTGGPGVPRTIQSLIRTSLLKIIL